METDECHDFLACGEVTSQLAQQAPGDFRTDERVLGRTRPTRVRIEDCGSRFT